MKRKPLHRPTFKAIALAAVLATGAALAPAAENPLTKVRFDAARGVNILDLTMTLDWDFDSPPAGRDKAFIEGIIRQASQSLFTMTEGKQMLGKVYVYKNSQFMNNTDIQYLVADGRANAHVAGLNACRSCRVQQFAGTGETTVDHGKTVAHEFGHYVLGLYDEYREAGGTSTEPGAPQDGDTPKNSIMHNHLQFPSLSTADDYTDSTALKTAQYRVYGKSAWDVLAQAPSADPESMGGRRIHFDAFKNMAAPTGSGLRRPSTGWENDLQIVYMGSSTPPATSSPSTPSAPASSDAGPINAIIIDTTTTAEHLAAQLNAASQMIDAAGANNRVMVFAFPFNSAPAVPLTRLTDDAARSAVKAAIGRIGGADDTSDAVVAGRLFDWAEAVAPAVAPKGPATQSASGFQFRVYPTGIALGVSQGTVFLYNPAANPALAALGPVAAFLPQIKGDYTGAMQKALDTLKATKTLADTPSVTLFTVATRTVDTNLVSAFRDASIAVNPVGITTPGAAGQAGRLRAQAAGQTSLHDLAKQTFGSFKEGAKAGDIARAAGKVANAAEGDSVETANDAESGALAAGGRHEVSTVIASGGVDGKTVFNAYWKPSDTSKLAFTITTPAGTTISPTSLPQGITYRVDAAEGEASYIVAANFAGLAGTWRSTVSASGAVADGVFQEVLVDSQLAATVDLFGMNAGETGPVYAMVEVSGPVAVEFATVKADIFNATTGATVRSGLVLKDDGVAPDEKANDGKYSINLTDLARGEYEIVVTVTNGGQAVFSTSGNTKQGTNKPAVPVPNFQRVTSETFVKDR